MFSRKGEEAHHSLRDKFSSAVSSVIDDVSVANNDLLSSIDRKCQSTAETSTKVVVTNCELFLNESTAGTLKLDHDAREKLNTIIGPSSQELMELRSCHYNKTVDISENAGKCLLEEYTVRMANMFK